MTALRIAPVTRAFAQRVVAEHHSHHEPARVDVFRLGAFVGLDVAGVVVAGTPIAPALDNGTTWEVTRLCCLDSAPRFTASRLLGAIGRVAFAAGVDLLVSYTRVDERGSCYIAAGYTPAALSKGRGHTTGNRANRWLPGFYEPSTEIIDRVRWERGPRAGSPGALWNVGALQWEALGVDGAP